MKTRCALLHSRTSITIMKPGLLALGLFTTLINITNATSINIDARAGQSWLGNGYDYYDISGPDTAFLDTALGTLNDVSSYDNINTQFGGRYTNTQTGSTYDQAIYANAQVGHLQLASMARTSASATEPTTIQNSTRANGWWQDSFTITSLSAATTGYMSFNLNLTGSTSASGGGGISFEGPWSLGYASWNMEIGLSGGALYSESASGHTGSFEGDFGDSLPYSLLQNSIQFSFGVPISVFVKLGTNANAVAMPGELTYAETRILNSLEWGGITGVVDASGNPLAFSLSSDSSYDYRLAFADSPQGNSVVPLPSSMVLFGSGLLGLAGLRKKRKKIIANE